jgi:hypothetical protein
VSGWAAFPYCSSSIHDLRGGSQHRICLGQLLFVEQYIKLVGHHSVARDFYYQLSLPLCLTRSFSVSVSVDLSFSLSLSLSLSFSVSVSVDLSFSFSLSLSLSLSLSPPPPSLSLSLSLSLPLLFFVSLSRFSFQIRNSLWLWFQVWRLHIYNVDCSIGNKHLNTNSESPKKATYIKWCNQQMS